MKLVIKNTYIYDKLLVDNIISNKIVYATGFFEESVSKVKVLATEDMKIIGTEDSKAIQID